MARSRGTCTERHSTILEFQRAAGNGAVASLLASRSRNAVPDGPPFSALDSPSLSNVARVALLSERRPTDVATQPIARPAAQSDAQLVVSRSPDAQGARTKGRDPVLGIDYNVWDDGAESSNV